MKAMIRIECGGSARLAVLALLLAACQSGEEALSPETGEDEVVLMGETPVVGAALQFGTPQLWSSFFCRKGEVCQVADVNHDGKADAIAFSHGANNSNAVFVALSNGTRLGLPQQWSSFFCRSTETCAVGDVNQDSRPDLIAFTRGTTPRVFVALSTGTGFGAPQQWSSFFCRNGEVCKVADVNWDHRADLVAFRHRPIGNPNGVYVALSNGSSFGAPQEWTNGFCQSTQTCEVGDLTGDGSADILALTRDPSNDVFVGLSKQPVFGGGLPTQFELPALWSSFFCRTGEVCLVADVTGDRRQDLIAFNHGLDSANAVFVGQSTGAGFLPATKAHDFFCTKAQTCAVGDMTGDGKADVVAFTRGTNPRVFVGVSQ